jgi:4-hydroxy-2-oxovalerate aldolase
MSKIFITDTSMRDGNHSISHQISYEEVQKLAAALDQAKIDIIEVGHGDGLVGASCNYGFSAITDFQAIEAAASVCKFSKVAVLCLPGIATVPDLVKAKEKGATVLRVATHVTEADVSWEHITNAKKIGFFVVGFLMMAHRASVERIVSEAKKMESYGADVVYATDSAGAMVPDEVHEKISAMCSELKIPIGYHSHNNLGLSVGNSLAAIKAGATYIDGSLGGFGAGAGNTPTEVLAAVLRKCNYDINADMFKAISAATDVLEPIAKRHGVSIPKIHDSLIIGYAGVYSSFMLHAKRAAKRFDVDYRDIILEAGRRGAVGGQEDWLYEIASYLKEGIIHSKFNVR